MAFDFAALIDALTTLTKAVKEGTKATEKAAPAPAAAPGLTAPRADSLRGRLGRLRAGGLGSSIQGLGGFAGVGGAAGRLAGPLGIAAGVLKKVGDVAIPAINDGIIAAGRGGDVGAAVARNLNAQAAKIPLLGEYFGIAPLVRSLEGTESDLNSATGQAARILGPGGIDRQTRSFLASRLATENVNLELDRQLNNDAVNRVSPLAQAQLGALAISGGNINHLIQAAGVQQNQ